MSGTELPDFPASQLFLRRLAFRLVRDEALADDVVQEAWARWVERRPRGLAEPRAWLARVVRNLASNARRSAARRTRRERGAARQDFVPAERATEGTLEAQAHLVAALRELAEPYRSTLVQRYYHDLGPREIAERTGVPLETVRSRLARGLAKLREELDQRYGGERSTWCHWLATLGGKEGAAAPAPAGPAAAPRLTLGGAKGAPGGAIPLAAWAGALLTLAGALVVFVWNAREPRRGPEPLDEPHVAAAGPAARLELDVTPTRTAGEPEEAPEPEPAPVVEAVAPPSEQAAPRYPLEWPQFLGSASHAMTLTKRQGRLTLPKVLWHVPEAVGQPTASGGDLYAGGAALLSIDPFEGEIVTSVPDPTGRDPFVAAPAIGASIVLARRASDGTVQAYTRDLGKVLWSWTPAGAVRDPWAGCLVVDPGGESADDLLYIVACGDEVVALRSGSGKVAWRFRSEDEGTIDMAPAAGPWSVYFASDEGIVSGLLLHNGRRQWRFETGGWIADVHPLVLPDGHDNLVLLADRGSAVLRPGVDLAPEEEVWPGQNDRSGVLWAFTGYGKRERWRTPYGATALSPLGLANGKVIAGTRSQLVSFDLAGGVRDERELRTGSGPFAQPIVTGDVVLVGTHEGTLEARSLADGALSWAFRLPVDERVLAVVPAADRLFVATTLGLFCLGDDTGNPALPGDYVLDWTGALALSVAREREERKSAREAAAARAERRR